MSAKEKLALIEWNHPYLSIRRQCALLQLTRSSLYYERKPEVSADDKLIMDKIDEVYTKCPFYGSRKITRTLKNEGLPVNRKRVARLMGIMGIEAVYPRPYTSLSDKSHAVYPYLLGDIVVKRPNQVWGSDITYVRVSGSFLYLVAIMDWYSRYVVSWELSDTLTADFCCEALRKALTIGLPEIHNSDQGMQFTGKDYLGILKRYPSITRCQQSSATPASSCNNLLNIS